MRVLANYFPASHRGSLRQLRACFPDLPPDWQTWAQIGEALGLRAREVQSPTFTLIREHQGSGGRLVHVDLYRLEPGETAALGLEELLAGPGVKVVEWAERLPFAVAGARALRLARVSEAEGERREIVEETSDNSQCAR